MTAPSAPLARYVPEAALHEPAPDDRWAGRSPAARSGLPSLHVLGTRVDATTLADAADLVARWALQGESRSVAVATVNNVMEGHDDREYRAVMRRADLVTPDGMPLVWALRLLGSPVATRVTGADLTPAILRRAAPNGIPVGFFGGEPRVLHKFRDWAEDAFPGLEVAYAESPPFRPLSNQEEDRVAADIAASGARIVFVGLGCPKQELWMDRMRGKLPAAMVGVGAAFDFLAGNKRRAPRVLQRLGLEWAFRLACEPRRLWRRYARHNPRFVALFAAQLARDRGDGRSATLRSFVTPTDEEDA